MADEQVTAPATTDTPAPVVDAKQTAAPQDTPVAPVIPDKYEFKLSEGRQLDAGLIDAVSPLFKEFNLTQEAASKLVETYDKYGQAWEAQQEKEFQDFIKKADSDNIAAMKKEWGFEYDKKLGVAQKAIARFLGDAGKKKLADSGLGNDPEFMKAFYQAGLMIQEDTPPANVTAKPNGQSKLFQKSLGVN